MIRSPADQLSSGGIIHENALLIGFTPALFQVFDRCFVTFSVTVFVPMSAGNALGTVETFAVLGASTVADNGSSILTGTDANPGEPRL